MPLDHPGYDLVAIRGEEILLIEVKGHLGSKDKAEITFNQILACFKPDRFYRGAKWQLWNVENINRNSKLPPEIKIYEELSLEEFEPKSFYHDLRNSECIVVWRIFRS